METLNRPTTPEEVMGKVLRRAEVAKMARKLQDRLALASYKNKHGLENMSFTFVEAHFENTVAKMREESRAMSSGSSSDGSSDLIPYNRAVQSSPIAGPIFSDDVFPVGFASATRKRTRFQGDLDGPIPAAKIRKSKKNKKAVHSSPLKRSRAKPSVLASSPLDAKFSFQANGHQATNYSFVSSDSTISESPTFDAEEQDAPRLPTIHHGSPPRTPPPTRPRGLREKKEGLVNGEEGADLLMYLATSPSPAQALTSTRNDFPPSTPPTNPAVLPSSMINTPGGGGNSIFAGFSTPGQQFNFSDFCNVTPSPAQGAFNRTPGPSKTPLAAKEARRRLNFDNLLPPGSPSASRRESERGLGMELGGELRAHS